MRVARLAAVLGLVAGLGNCGGAAPPRASSAPPQSAAPAEPARTDPAKDPAAPAEPGPVGQRTDEVTTPDTPPPGASTGRLMQAHFTDALLIRKAVIAGTPERASRPAEALANAENLDDLPPGWRQFVEQMQQIARRINDSTSSAQAAGATADLGVTCGGCHVQRGGPKASSTPAPPEGQALAERMQRHAWATERLWEGLTVPSSEAWDAGAKVLSSSPFSAQTLPRGGMRARSAASDFAKLVAKAPSKKTVEARAALYAELLVVCGGCHRAINEDGTK
jgi:hypothetical protein